MGSIRLRTFEPFLVHIHAELIFSLGSKDLLDVKNDGIERRVKTSMITRVGNHAVDIGNDPLSPLT